MKNKPELTQERLAPLFDLLFYLFIVVQMIHEFFKSVQFSSALVFMKGFNKFEELLLFTRIMKVLVMIE